MKPISQNSASYRQVAQSETSEAATTKSEALRTEIASAKSQNKMILTPNHLNQHIKQNLSPEKYGEVAKDVKGYVAQNFYLTAGQKKLLNAMSSQSTQKIQDAIQKAGQLNKEVVVEFQSSLSDDKLQSESKPPEFQDARIQKDLHLILDQGGCEKEMLKHQPIDDAKLNEAALKAEAKLNEAALKADLASKMEKKTQF